MIFQKSMGISPPIHSTGRSLRFLRSPVILIAVLLFAFSAGPVQGAGWATARMTIVNNTACPLTFGSINPYQILITGLKTVPPGSSIPLIVMAGMGDDFPEDDGVTIPATLECAEANYPFTIQFAGHGASWEKITFLSWKIQDDSDHLMGFTGVMAPDENLNTIESNLKGKLDSGSKPGQIALFGIVVGANFIASVTTPGLPAGTLGQARNIYNTITNPQANLEEGATTLADRTASGSGSSFAKSLGNSMDPEGSTGTGGDGKDSDSDMSDDSASDVPDDVAGDVSGDVGTDVAGDVGKDVAGDVAKSVGVDILGDMIPGIGEILIGYQVFELAKDFWDDNSDISISGGTMIPIIFKPPTPPLPPFFKENQGNKCKVK